MTILMTSDFQDDGFRASIWVLSFLLFIAEPSPSQFQSAVVTWFSYESDLRLVQVKVLSSDDY